MSNTQLDISSVSVAETILGFDVVCIVVDLACIGCISILVRRGAEGAKALPLWTILGCLSAWILYYVFSIIGSAASFTSNRSGSFMNVAESYVVVQTLFQWIATCANLYIFHALIHLMLRQTVKSTRPWHKTRIFHWVCFGIVVLVGSMIFFMICAYYYYNTHSVNYFSVIRASKVYPPMLVATTIVAWIATLENMAWSLYLGIRHTKCFGGHIRPTIFLITSATFWSGATLMVALNAILNDVVKTGNTSTSDSVYGISVIGVAVVGILGDLARILYWIGIVLFCFRCAKIQTQRHDEEQEEHETQEVVKLGELPAEVKFDQKVPHEMPSKAFVAELPGDHTQVYEAENNYIVEADSPQKYEMPDFESLDATEKGQKKGA